VHEQERPDTDKPDQCGRRDGDRKRHPQQKRPLPTAEMNRCPSQRPKRDEWLERDHNLEDAATVTGLTISMRASIARRATSAAGGAVNALFLPSVPRYVSLSATCKIRLRDD
jgi:hypothetical protein